MGTLILNKITMASNDNWCLHQAIEITKEFAKGGSDKVTPGFVLEDVYKKLQELSKGIQN